MSTIIDVGRYSRCDDCLALVAQLHVVNVEQDERHVCGSCMAKGYDSSGHPLPDRPSPASMARSEIGTLSMRARVRRGKVDGGAREQVATAARRYVREHPDATYGEVAEIFGITPSALVGMLHGGKAK
jgi:hypothetical protein